MAEARMRPRVALVAHDIHDGGGMERAFAELLRRASPHYDFTVYASSLAADLRPLVAWRHIPTPARPFPLKFSVFFFVAGLRVRGTGADLIHTLGAVVPNRAHLATIPFCHAGYVAKLGRLTPDTSGPLQRLNRGISRSLALAAERWCYRRSRLQLFAPVSQGVREELASHYPAIPSALTPNGVDTDRYKPDPGRRASMRGEESVENGEIVCVFVGGDWDRKGLELAIEALALANAEERGLRLWVVGRGDRHRYEQLAVKHGLAQRVRFFGPRNDAERFYQAADVLVLPTEYETFSLVAYEAAASCLPVLATRVSGIEDLVADGESGFLVERRAEAVADALVRLALDPELRVRMGREGRRRASAYTWERSVDSVVRVYEQLLNGREEIAA
jgi:glycosyltransferase involved in cell wall biosynthesis